MARVVIYHTLVSSLSYVRSKQQCPCPWWSPPQREGEANFLLPVACLSLFLLRFLSLFLLCSSSSVAFLHSYVVFPIVFLLFCCCCRYLWLWPWLDLLLYWMACLRLDCEGELVHTVSSTHIHFCKCVLLAHTCMLWFLIALLEWCFPAAAAAAAGIMHSRAHESASEGICTKPTWLQLRQISLLTLSLLNFVDSDFPGDSLWTWEFHPLKLRLCLSQTLLNPEA